MAEDPANHLVGWGLALLGKGTVELFRECISGRQIGKAPPNVVASVLAPALPTYGGNVVSVVPVVHCV